MPDGVLEVGRTRTRVSTAFVPHAHHSRWSGYPRFVARLDGGIEARPCPAWRLTRRMLERGSGRIAFEWFGPDNLAADLAAARRLVIGDHEVVHLLYGETDHFYAGRWRALGARRGNRLIATFHHPPALHEQLLPAPVLFGQLDHAIALGARAATHLETLIGEGRVSRAFLGVDTHAWRPAPRARAEVPTCAFVGSWLRDFDVLAEVARIVREREPRARFEVVGSPSRSERLARLPGVRARAGISDSEVREVYQRSWVHALPLTDAVGNNALLEGMACGTPTVVTAVGDVTDYTGRAAAVLTRPGDAGQMAEEVLRLFGDRDERRRLGRLARAQAETRDLTAAARRHAEIYREVAAR